MNDLQTSSIALSVGAMDAYLCDKYVDCVTAVLRAYANGDWRGALPAHYAKTPLPAGEVLKTTRSQRPLWSIRMAARKLMERDNMLQIGNVPDNFNPILPDGQKLWTDLIDTLISKNRRRFTDVVPGDLVGLNDAAAAKKRKSAIVAFKKRLAGIIQIRHDWIHNCARPKSSIVDYTRGQTVAFTRDVKTFVEDLDSHIEAHRRA